jgi:ATP-binding cassette subfamily B protein
VTGLDEEPEEGDRRSRAMRLAVRVYLGQLGRDKRIAVPALLLPALGNVLTIYLPPLIVANILRAYAGAGGDAIEIGDLVPFLAQFAAAWLGGEICWRFGIHFLCRVDVRGIARLYTEGMDALLRKDLAFFQDNFAGSLTKKVIAYSKSFEEFGDTLTFSVSSSLLPLTFVSVVLWRFSPLLPIMLIGWLVLTLALVVPLIRRRKKLVDEREAASNEVAGHVADSIANMEAVRAFAREPFEAEIHKDNVRRYARKVLRSWDYQNQRVEMVTMPMYVLANLSGIVLAIHVGRGGLLSLETVFVTFSYYASATRVMWDFNQIYRNIESTLAEAAQFCELLLDEPTVLDVVDPEPLRPAGRGVRFDGVRFRYPNTADRLFDGLDLDVADGERIGLVGRSGGGKTTITRLLLRLMDVEGGRILVGGQDIARLRQADLRALIAYVPQDPVMFHRSLRDNIAFGRLDATDEEIHAAAEAAHAAEFIDELAEGYDTLVGERGIKLSGGQRQRIAIARAIVRAAPILVLDEATSSLDSESEALIQLGLHNLMERSTSLVIAHRLSTVQQMDRLVVLDRGRVVEEGTHAALVSAGGTYAGLWARQSGGFLVVEDGGEVAEDEAIAV